MNLDFIENELTSGKLKEKSPGSQSGSALNTLIRQNEDLHTNLQIALKRLATLEESQILLEEDNLDLKRQNAALFDQISVLRQKDSAWKEEISRLQTQTTLAQERSLALTAQQDQMLAEIQRHRKYQEKIRNQVKPYLLELKTKNTELLKFQSDLENQLESRETSVKTLKQQILDLAENSKKQIYELDSTLRSSLEASESQIQSLKEDLSSLQERNFALENNLIRLHKAQEERERIENENILLKHNHRELEQKLTQEILRLQNLCNDQHRSEAQSKIQIENLQGQLQLATQAQKKEQQDKWELERQLDSVRYLFGEKSKDLERVSQSLVALERLNLELSQKLHQIVT